MKGFDAWALPPGGEDPVGVEAVQVDPGEVRIRYPSPDPEWWLEVAGRVRSARSASLESRSAEELASALGRVGARFLDDEDPLRGRALELLPPVAGLSDSMAREVLEGMARDWTEERLLRLLRVEFPDPEVLDGFRPGGEGRSVRVLGPALTVQICAGTVPGVSVTALIRSLLVKSPVIVKPGRGDVVLPVLFARALAREDPALAAAAAVGYWPGGTPNVEDPLLGRAEAVVAYGGDDTVRDLRSRTPVTATFVGYRHRLSAGLVGREALSGPGRAERAADRAARSVALFDQRGCVSPHVLYVEGGAAVEPEGWAQELADAFRRLEASLPSGPLRMAEASRIQQLRGTAELEESAGAGVRVYHGGEDPWTVVVEEEPGFRPSCLGRVVRVRPVEDLAEAVEELADIGRYLQTVSLDGVGTRHRALAEALARAGAVRITTPRRVPWPPPWWHHDGGGPLRDLVRWIDLEAEGPDEE